MTKDDHEVGRYFWVEWNVDMRKNWTKWKGFSKTMECASEDRNLIPPCELMSKCCSSVYVDLW